MIAHLFPGQGSQYVGMGKELREAYPAARARMEEADDILHLNLSATMLDGPDEVLRQTQYTQPAIFLHSVISWTMHEERVEPQAMAGHSLGEYSALHLSGAMSFADALELVYTRGRLMAEAGRRNEGTMAAVIGMESAKLEAVCSEVESETGQIVRAANFNSPGQIVISGSKLGVSDAMRRAKGSGARMVKELPVSGAFHSPLMQYAADGLKEALQSTLISSPRVPVFSNVTTEPVEDPSSIRSLLVEQLTAPVRWEQSIRNLYDFGVREFVEYGPGNVLQGLVTRTLEGVSSTGFSKPAVAA